MPIAILKNDFHNTEVGVRFDGRWPLSPRQLARIRRKLCGQSGCACGVIRGPQTHYVDTVGVGPDGGDLVALHHRAHDLVGRIASLHPASDYWMRGDKYADIVHVDDYGRMRVRFHRSGRERWIHQSDVLTTS